MNMLPLQRDFADVIKLKILRWEDYPGLCTWAQSNHKSYFKKGAGESESEKAM